MRIAVDADRCTGHGRCYSVAPELLDSDESGYVNIRGTSIDVPAGLEPAAEEAASWCPEQAVTLER
jgi:ferredoxin